MLSRRQLTFGLEPSNPFSLEYFVPHSGVVDAMEVLRRAEKRFQLYVLTGPPGSGKTHLARGAAEAAGSMAVVDLRQFGSGGGASGQFVAQYECAKSESIPLLVECRGGEEAVSDPSVSSRIRSGVELALQYPRDDELRPLVIAILERHHLRLADSALEFLLERVPSAPQALATLVSAIREEAFSTDRTAGKRLIARVLAGGN